MASPQEDPRESEDEQLDAPRAPAPRGAVPLRFWERLSAGAIGVAGAGAGGVGVFLSDNQAGTTALLVLGVVFLIMAIQGTALRQLNKDGGVYADRADEERAVKRIERVREEQGAEAAQAALESATAARPELKNSPAVQVMTAHLYGDLLLAYIQQAWRDAFNESPRLTQLAPDQEQGLDAVIESDQNRRLIGIDTIYTTGERIPFRASHSMIHRHQGSAIPVLVVANRPLARGAEDSWLELAKDGRHHFVLWRGPEDGLALERGLRRLREAIEDTGATR